MAIQAVITDTVIVAIVAVTATFATVVMILIVIVIVTVVIAFSLSENVIISFMGRSPKS